MSIPRPITRDSHLCPKSALQQFEQARAEGRKLDHAEGGDEFAGLFHVSVQPPREPDGQAFTRTDVTLGRGFWIASMRRLLTGVARVLTDHQWSILEPGDESEWPLTDHPVLKLNSTDRVTTTSAADGGGGMSTS